MSDLNSLRVVISEALDEISSAENVFAETIEQVKDEGLESRQFLLSNDDDLERNLISFRNRVERTFMRSGRALSELRISRRQHQDFIVQNNLNLEEILGNMRAIAIMCEEALAELEETAEKLVIERKK